MKRSTDRILTTHTGSLPRPPEIFDLLQNPGADKGGAPSRAARFRDAVSECVRQQADAGIDVVSDGEQSKPGFYVYLRDRLSGMEGVNPEPQPFINPDFPGYNAWRESRGRHGGGPPGGRPECVGPLRWKDRGSLQAETDNLRAALANVQVEEAFLPSASVSLVSQRIENKYYPTTSHIWRRSST
jgi:5-methyltetrahydropteroyltriglutamate--homocysteine methyltransferase